MATKELPFPCDQPGCDAAYNLPQHLGLHRFHKHGIPGSSRTKHFSERAAKRSRLNASDICLTVLTEVATKGTIPLTALAAYEEWVRATERFLNTLNGSKEDQ